MRLRAVGVEASFTTDLRSADSSDCTPPPLRRQVSISAYGAG